MSHNRWQGFWRPINDGLWDIQANYERIEISDTICSVNDIILQSKLNMNVRDERYVLVVLKFLSVILAVVLAVQVTLIMKVEGPTM